MPAAERFSGTNNVEAGKLSPYWGEHVARYVFALPFVKQKRILDIACGTGYGVSFLQDEADFTIGVDLDREAARQALSECSVRAAVLLADGLVLPFSDESFDVITSFETLEHLHERREFLSELRRILRPGGLLILSTPNANYTQPVYGVPSNPFHVFEYSPDELMTELNEVFVIENFLGQTLNISGDIPPFHDAQQRLPTDVRTQARLYGWKVLSRFPPGIRERLSQAIWSKPFYPTESDYAFSNASVDTAPVLVALCRK